MFEAMFSGALVFVDEMFAPAPHPLRHGEHVVVYSPADPAAFQRLVAHYLAHPLDARRIARQGYLHALQYHRSVSRVDYYLRTAHQEEEEEARRPPAGGAETHQAAATAYAHTGQAIHKASSHAMLVHPTPENWE